MQINNAYISNEPRNYRWSNLCELTRLVQGGWSSNVNEVIRAVLNSFFLFYEKILYAPKVPKSQRRNQAKAQKRK